MTRRAMLLGTAGTLAIFSLFRWGAASDAAPATKFEIEKSDEEWRKLLTPAQYDVLRKHGTERPGTSPLNEREAQGHVRLRGLRPAAVLVRDEISKAAPAGRASGSRWRTRSAPRPTSRS